MNNGLQQQQDFFDDEFCDAIHPVQFTPGTELMSWIKDALCYRAVQTLMSKPEYRNVRVVFKIYICSLSAKVKIFVSGADRDGEGELKIFEHLRTVPTKKDSVLIVSNDSDILLFST